MANTQRKPFTFTLRRFAVLTAALTGLGLPISGLAVHLHQMEPIFSVSRHAWMSAHAILGILFTAATLSHAVLNRRVLLNYIRDHAVRSGIGLEGVGAIVLVAVMLLLAVGHACH